MTQLINDNSNRQEALEELSIFMALGAKYANDSKKMAFFANKRVNGELLIHKTNTLQELAEAEELIKQADEFTWFDTFNYEYIDVINNIREVRTCVIECFEI
jgi:hypothetical protein